MNARPVPSHRRPFRLIGALLAGLLAIVGLVAAVAQSGSATQLSAYSAGVAVDTSAVPPVDTSLVGGSRVSAPGSSERIDKALGNPVPLCGKREHPAADPLGNIAAPPRTVGDQLLSPVTGLTPEFTATHRLSYQSQPRAPTLPVASPHLTTVLLI